jgi:hypothetical protein
MEEPGMKWISKWFTHLSHSRRCAQSRKPIARIPRRLYLEPLEDRCLLSGYPTPYGLSPTQVRHAYGIDAIRFNGVTGDGSGQTIAIVDPYDNPNIVSDLHNFDAYFNLPDPPSFRKVDQNGGANLPGVDPVGPGQANWEAEEALNVEWAHALAPQASIILVEASSANALDMIGGGVNWARQQPGVSVVSVGYAAPGEFQGETAYDSTFTTPTGHSGVTFVAPAGNQGAPGGYASLSPNVLGVGGTSLTLNGGNYGSETAWNNAYGKSGGGLSTIESRPSYQNGVAAVVGNHRGAPDVAFVSDPLTGVDVYDTYNGSVSTPWTERGGTNLGAPAWAALIAVADQGRALIGLGSLDGPSQTLPMLYSLPSSDFHDVTTGNNSTYAAGPGYDLATGLGTPVANLLVPDLVVPPTDDAQFVRGVFTDATQGLTAAGGFNAALTQVDAARTSVLSTYANSYVLSLGRPQLVQDLYGSTAPYSVLGVGDLIGRAITPGEANYWATQLQNGMSYEQMIVQLTSSSTYFAETGAGHVINGNDAAFVRQIYNDLFHRNPSAYEQNTLFVPQLNAAENLAHQQDAHNLLGGQAYQTAVVQALYTTYMGRAAGVGDMAFGLNLLQQGGTPEQLIAAILGSGEYFSHEAPLVVGGGATAGNDTLIRAMYKQLFPGYTISQWEVNHWVGPLNSGAISGQQIANILDTTGLYRFGTTGAPSVSASYNGLADRAYEQYLGRHANQSEITYWASVYNANPNYPTQNLVEALLGSAEFYNRNNPQAPLQAMDARFADNLYTAALGAPNTTAEQTIDLPFLTNAEVNARAAIGQAIVGSQEYHNDVTTTVYQHFLNRLPSTYELSEWGTVVGQGAAQVGGANGDEQLLAAVFSSNEYFMDQKDAVTHLSTNDSWLRSLYPKLRVAFNATDESTQLGNVLAAYAPARQAVVNAIVSSPEYLTQVVQSLYTTYMGRSAQSGDVAFGLNLLQQGGTQEQLIAAILGSGEYFNREAPSVIAGGATAGNDTLIRAMYKQLFPGYTIGQWEVNYWVNQLNAGTITGQQIANILDTAGLYRFGTTGTPTVPLSYNGWVDGGYVRYMGRHAVQSEISYWAGVYSAHPNYRYEDLIKAILNSEEYFLRTRTF